MKQIEYLGEKSVKMLTRDEISLMCECIIHYGNDEHPVADPSNLRFFAKDYACGCVARACQEGFLTEEGRAEAMAIIMKLMAEGGAIN